MSDADPASPIEGAYYWIEVEGDITVAQWLEGRWFAVGNEEPILYTHAFVLSDRLFPPPPLL